MNNQTIITDSNISTEKSLYETDFYQWALHNAGLLKQGKLADIDIENVAEELESMSRSEKKELRNRLAILMMHLLKWQYQPQHRSMSWKLTINTQRADIELVLEDSPSLKHNIEITIEDAFKRAESLFEKETNISKKYLPQTCPYTFEQLSDYEFWP